MCAFFCRSFLSFRQAKPPPEMRGPPTLMQMAILHFFQGGRASEQMRTSFLKVAFTAKNGDN
jgi:hypothetical protein